MRIIYEEKCLCVWVCMYVHTHTHSLLHYRSFRSPHFIWVTVTIYTGWEEGGAAAAPARWRWRQRCRCRGGGATAPARWRRTDVDLYWNRSRIQSAEAVPIRVVRRHPTHYDSQLRGMCVCMWLSNAIYVIQGEAEAALPRVQIGYTRTRCSMPQSNSQWAY